jgi:hypothetical protein
MTNKINSVSLDGTVLLLLETSCWGISKKVPQNKVLEQMPIAKYDVGDNGKSEDLNVNWLRNNKYLINPSYLSPIQAEISAARTKLKRFGLPFPVKGLNLVPQDLVVTIDAHLKEHKENFEKLVAEFIDKLDEAKQEAQRNLGPWFDASQYNIRFDKEFAFDWSMLSIQTPGELSKLSPELYEREVKKFEDLMEETREQCVLALRMEMSELVNHITERLEYNADGTPKIFRDSLLTNIQYWIELFKSRNVFYDAELQELVDKAKTILGGISPDDLRSYENMRKDIQQKFKDVKADIDLMVKRPVRKVTLATNPVMATNEEESEAA